MPKGKDSFSFFIVALMSSVVVLISSTLVHANQDWRGEMLNQINVIRKEAGVKPLKLCSSLNSSSQNYSAKMARENFFSHNGKDGSTLKSRTEKAGYVMKTGSVKFALGENIAKGQRNVNEVLNSWRNSKGHYKNLIETNFTHVGLGRARHGNTSNVFFWVQNFGTGGNCALE